MYLASLLSRVGANFWLRVLTGLNNRGLLDILIACTDNLKGFIEALPSIFPKAQVQKYIVHQMQFPQVYRLKGA